MLRQRSGDAAPGALSEYGSHQVSGHGNSSLTRLGLRFVLLCSVDAYLLRRPGPVMGGGIGMLGVAAAVVAVASETITARANAAAAALVADLPFMVHPPGE